MCEWVSELNLNFIFYILAVWLSSSSYSVFFLVKCSVHSFAVCICVWFYSTYLSIFITTIKVRNALCVFEINWWTIRFRCIWNTIGYAIAIHCIQKYVLFRFCLIKNEERMKWIWNWLNYMLPIVVFVYGKITLKSKPFRFEFCFVFSSVRNRNESPAIKLHNRIRY